MEVMNTYINRRNFSEKSEQVDDVQGEGDVLN